MFRIKKSTDRGKRRERRVYVSLSEEEHILGIVNEYLLFLNIEEIIRRRRDWL